MSLLMILLQFSLSLWVCVIKTLSSVVLGGSWDKEVCSAFHVSPCDFGDLHGPALYLDIWVLLSLSRNAIVMGLHEVSMDWAGLVTWSGWKMTHPERQVHTGRKRSIQIRWEARKLRAQEEGSGTGQEWVPEKEGSGQRFGTQKITTKSRSSATPSYRPEI